MKKEKKTKQPTSQLLEALDFISVAQKEQGLPHQTHCRMINNYIVSMDGVLSAGSKITEDIVACPHTFMLLMALKKCKETLSLTMLENNRISVQSGKLKVIVPCASFDVMQSSLPDIKCGVIDNKIRLGFELLSPLISENSQHLATASLYLKPFSMVATNRHVIFEYWHGYDLPPNLILPKAFINAVMKIKKDIEGFGFSDRTFTLWFSDGSWLKTQLYKETWPDVNAILNAPIYPSLIPSEFFEALNTINSFPKEDKIVYFLNNKLQSTINENSGVFCDVEGLPNNLAFNTNYLLMLENIANKIDFTTYKDKAYFVGENIRGAVCGIHFNQGE
jgi:hypothetical protein